MHVAAGRGDIEALVTLSKMHYDINEQEAGTLNTPLHMAVLKCNYEVVCCIIDYYSKSRALIGASIVDLSIQNKKGDTPLHIASRLEN